MRLRSLLFCCCAATLLAGPAPAQRSPDPAGPVTLLVFAADSAGAPVPAARVMLPGSRSALTDSAGHVRFDRLEPGPARVRVSRIGYRGVDTVLTLPSAGEIRLAVQLTAAPVAVQTVTATGVPDSAFVGDYILEWHAPGGSVPVRLQVQRHGEGYGVTWFPTEGRAMVGERVRVRGRTLSFSITGRAPVQISLNVNRGIVAGRWQATSGASGRLTGRKSP